MPSKANTNPWGDAANQAVGAMYKYYLSQPTAADKIKMQLQSAQLDEMQRGQSMGDFTMQNLSPEIRNDLYRRKLEGTHDSEGAKLFGTYVNKPMQVDAGDTKYIVDGSTGMPMQQYGVGVAPDTTFDKDGNRLITTPAVPATNRPAMPSSPMGDLFASVVHNESGGDPTALSPKGAAGVAQIMPDTARDPGFGVQPLQGWDGVDPRTAPVPEQMRFGNDYLNAMVQQRGGNVAEGVAAYNAGPGAVAQHGGIPPYPETQAYVQNVLADASNPQQAAIQQVMPSAQQPIMPAAPKTQASTVQPDGTVIQPLPMSPADAAKKTERDRLKGIQGSLVNDDIHRALSTLDSAALPTTGMVGSMTQNIPGTASHNLQQTLTTIKANIGFDKLQAMREASPTGGALGQVSDFENTQLQAIYGSLAQSQSEEQFRYNLMRLYNTYNDIIDGAGNGDRYDIPSIEKVSKMNSPEEIQQAMEFFDYNPPDDIEQAIIQRANQLGL